MKRYLIDRVPAKDERSLMTLVENRTSFSFEMCELNLFETHKTASNVNLVFDHFVLTSMISGKKIMKLPESEAFDYLPGESVIVPPGDMMNIDFPEAKKWNPTQCLALCISDEMIQDTIDQLNEYHPKSPHVGSWGVDPKMFHLANNLELSDTINRIIRLSRNEGGKSKDLMINLTLQEMLIRLMQTQARVLLEKHYNSWSSANPIAAVMLYIKQNLRGRINMDKLADIAYMSRASFYKKFKESLGITPSQYIILERIELAKSDLQNPNMSISEVCYACGFENLSHFVKKFKSEVGITPKQYQYRIQNGKDSQR